VNKKETMKEYDCVQVNHHNDIGPVIEEYQGKGWHLHTYQAVGKNDSIIAQVVYHCLLFERDKVP
jgi:hypothetical protein